MSCSLSICLFSHFTRISIMLTCLSQKGTLYVWTGKTEDEKGSPVTMRDVHDNTYVVGDDQDRYKRFNQTFNSLLENKKSSLRMQAVKSLKEGDELPKSITALSNFDKKVIWEETCKRILPGLKQYPSMGFRN
jgi:hypothetical protein